MQPIKIAHREYRIVPISPIELDYAKLYGETNHHEATIRLAQDMEGTKFVEVLIHEILHACFKNYLPEKFVEDMMEEQLVGQMGVALTQVFNDNPHVLFEICNALARNIPSSKKSTRKTAKK